MEGYLASATKGISRGSHFAFVFRIAVKPLPCASLLRASPGRPSVTPVIGRFEGGHGTRFVVKQVTTAADCAATWGVPRRNRPGSIEVLRGDRAGNRLGDEAVPRMSRVNIANELICDVRIQQSGIACFAANRWSGGRVPKRREDVGHDRTVGAG